MTSGGFDCTPSQADQVANTMRTATAPLDGMASAAPETPNAGTATGAVIDVLTSLSEAMRDFTQASDATGQQVSEAVATYRRDDTGAAGNVNSVPIPGPPR